MSHLRAPAPRADRREGGRHGRPVARTVPSLPETHIRPQLVRLAVLPPLAVALSACAAVLFLVRSSGVRPTLTLFAVLAGAVGVALGGIVIALVAADRTARSVGERVGALRQTSARSEAELRALVEALRRGDAPPARRPRGEPAADADDFELLGADLARAHDGAVTAVVQASQLSSQAGSEQKVEVFVNLARRLQSLVHREISILDELEHEIEDPDLLKGLFHVDHLATRIRRHAENLAVLGGAVSRRQWSNPVSMTEVLRSAIAEVEQYSRVKLVPPIDGTLRGHAVADVIHLLAELVENATLFSAPHTQVLLRANLVTSGLAVEVEDRGLGMPVDEQHKMNALLTDPDQVNVASLLQDGRIGLFVVSQLARRHGIHVRLQTNIYGGVQAVLVVPQGLLGTAAGQGAPVAVPQPRPQATPQPRTQTQAQIQETGGMRRVAEPPRQRPSAAGREGRSPAPGTQPGGPASRRPEAPVRPAAPAPNGRGPAPLPVRGAHLERPNPAEATPGIRPDDRRTVADHTSTPPTPRNNSAVRGTMGKPQLPRRRAQEHIAPQLRGGPAAPRPESEQVVEHDPGLMAAFQRGIGLAEARQLEADYTDPAVAAMEREYEARYGDRARAEVPSGQPASPQPPYVEPAYPADSGERARAEVPSGLPASPQPPYVEPAYPADSGERARAEVPSGLPASPQPSYAEPAYPADSGAAPLEPASMERVSPRATGPGLTPAAPDTSRTDAAAGHRDSAEAVDGSGFIAVPPPDTSPIPEAHRLRAPGHDLDLTARHDGSAPAG